MSKYLLDFKLDIHQSENLLIGELTLKKDNAVINVYRATSSLPGRQVAGSWERRGGLLPPGLDYAVNLKPFSLPHVPGVNDGEESYFFQILPLQIEIAGIIRGDWGIHFDGNAPGTLGCVGIETRRGWRACKRDLLAIAQIIPFIDLHVSYL